MELYRYDDTCFDSFYLGWSEGIPVKPIKVFTTKETPCGYWFRKPFSLEPSWVSKNGRKRWAYEDKMQALESYIARKYAQISIVEEQLRRAKLCLKNAKRYKKLEVKREILFRKFNLK
jgi:hypothetical protein